jgi:hypothetical protein
VAGKARSAGYLPEAKEERRWAGFSFFRQAVCYTAKQTSVVDEIRSFEYPDLSVMNKYLNDLFHRRFVA